MLKKGQLSPLVPLYMQMERFSRVYNWTPKQIREQYNEDLLAYEAIERGRKEGVDIKNKKVK